MLLAQFVANLTDAISAIDARGRENEIGRPLLKAALSDEEFVLDTMARQLEILRVSDALSQRGPIVLARVPRFHLRLIYWAPGYAVTPHEHDEWTVGGVLLNEVEVAIYDTIDAATPSRTYVGKEGDVGILDPPTVHQLVNRTSSPSVTLHVFGHKPLELDRDGRTLSAGQPPSREIDTDNLREYSTGLRQRIELSIVQILAKRPSIASARLLRRLADIGSAETKAAAARAIFG